MRALIDGDPVLYAACYATEYNTWFHPDLGTFRRQKELQDHLFLFFDDDDLVDWKTHIAPIKVTEPITNTYHAIDGTISSILRKTGATDYTIYLSDGGNFRNDIEYPVQYKGGRPEKPSNFTDARKYLKGLPNVTLVSGIEVDDALGIQQDKTGYSTCICTIDKDLGMIPGLHFDIKSNDPIYLVNEFDANKAFWKQMLTGDRTDNIIGLKGYGPVTAEKTLSACKNVEDMQMVVQEHYRVMLKDGWEKLYEANKILLWILQEPLNA